MKITPQALIREMLDLHSRVRTLQDMFAVALQKHLPSGYQTLTYRERPSLVYVDSPDSAGRHRYEVSLNDGEVRLTMRNTADRLARSDVHPSIRFEFDAIAKAYDTAFGGDA